MEEVFATVKNMRGVDEMIELGVRKEDFA